MRRLTLFAGLAVGALCIWLFAFGGLADLTRWASSGQRAAQNMMAGAIRRLQGGDPMAVMSLWGLCFAYGFLHAAGPGHGKFVIGSYGLGRRVPAFRLMVLALGSSLAQAMTAILMVGAGVLILGWQRDRMQGLADGMLAQLSSALILCLGLWLVWRGLRALWRSGQGAIAPLPAPGGMSGDLGGLAFGHAPTGQADEICATCGHAHGPTLAQAEAARSFRDGVALILAIAARPCTGALFLLLLTWQLGLFWAGAAGALIMGLGTACLTIVVAIGAVVFREGALMRIGQGAALPRVLAGAELLAGGLIVLISARMLLTGF